MIITLEQFRAARKRAASFARHHGCKMTQFEISETKPTGIVERTEYGYRKYTTGEYVSNAYRRNFGWRNTYYQEAHTRVRVNIAEVR